MAKCSREQRDRAVDLYVRYERYAADVIRELGYPSRGMLPVWYRERLEEERTGVPSRRGERYRRYTDEQKRAAVDHYLGHGRRLKRTMRALGYPKSHELLTAWIDELAPGRRKLRHGPVPEELKRKAVVAAASGRSESRDAAAGLGGEGLVLLLLLHTQHLLLHLLGLLEHGGLIHAAHSTGHTPESTFCHNKISFRII